jgi:hypothetical protein
MRSSCTRTASFAGGAARRGLAAAGRRQAGYGAPAIAAHGTRDPHQRASLK